MTTGVRFFLSPATCYYFHRFLAWRLWYYFRLCVI